MKMIIPTVALIIIASLVLPACSDFATQSVPDGNESSQTSTPLAATQPAEPIESTITSVRTATPNSPTATSAYYNPLLIYVESHPPTFEDDFSVVNPAWGRTSEHQRFEDGLVNGGVLHITDSAHDPAGMDPGGYPGVAAEEPGFVFPINGLFGARDFALQFDFRFSGVNNIGVIFRSSSFNYSTISAINIGYGVNFSPDGKWWLTQRDGTTLVSNTWTPRNGFNTLLVIVRDQSLIIVMNGEVLYNANNLEVPQDSITNGISGMGRDKERAVFDNVKFWNLDGVDFAK